MAKKKTLNDNYTNRTYAQVTQLVLNTLTFEQIRFAAGTFEGIALLLNRVKYYADTTTLRELVANTDHLFFGLTNRNDLDDIVPTSLSVLDQKNIVAMGAKVEPFHQPWVSDFTNLPMGGLLIAANPLYLAVDTGGMAAALASIYVVLEYQFRRLSGDENIELLQTMIPGNI